MFLIRTELKRGTAELLILSVLEQGPLHGYEIARRIETQSGGKLRFTLAALYPLLYRMEHRGWLAGAWETAENGRKRRRYKLLPRGKKMLRPLRQEWGALFEALRKIAKVSHG